MNFLRRKLRDDKGVVAIFVAITILVFIGVAALAVDVGYMMVGKTELQRAADGAALAATRALGHAYEGMSYEDQATYDCSGCTTPCTTCEDIRDAAINVAALNQAAKQNITLNSVDIEIGLWRPSQSPKFTATSDQPDAVRVTARRDGSANGPIGTFFAKIIGINTVPVNAVATAALTGESTAGAGGLPVPLGISQVRADQGNFCGDNIQLHPTKDSCAGWHTFMSNTHSAEQLRTILEDSLPAELREKKYKKDDPFVSPPAEIYKTEFNFSGGDIATVFDNFEKLFNYMKIRDGDGSGSDMCLARSGSKLCDEVWTTAVVIYQESGTTCQNPNNDIPIVGFSTMVIEEVEGPSGKTIWGKIACNYTEPGRGGGGNYGTKGSIPGLVQ